MRVYLDGLADDDSLADTAADLGWINFYLSKMRSQALRFLNLLDELAWERQGEWLRSRPDLQAERAKDCADRILCQRIVDFIRSRPGRMATKRELERKFPEKRKADLDRTLSFAWFFPPLRQRKRGSPSSSTGSPSRGPRSWPTISMSRNRSSTRRSQRRWRRERSLGERSSSSISPMPRGPGVGTIGSSSPAPPLWTPRSSVSSSPADSPRQRGKSSLRLRFPFRRPGGRSSRSGRRGLASASPRGRKGRHE